MIQDPQLPAVFVAGLLRLLGMCFRHHQKGPVRKDFDTPFDPSISRETGSGSIPLLARSDLWLGMAWLPADLPTREVCWTFWVKLALKGG